MDPDIEKKISDDLLKDATNGDAVAEQTLSWDDPREKRNPLHWSLGKKVFHTVVPCLLAFLITFSTSVTVPATTSIGIKFGISRTESILPLTVYTLGIGFGPIFTAPLSEMVGRKWVYVITITCLLAFTGGAGAAQNFGTLLACRALAGFFGSGGIAIGAGTIADIWALEKAGGMASLFFILGPFLGPTLGPLAGAYILHHHNDDWRWTQWLLLMVGAPIFIGSIVMKETSKIIILRKELPSSNMTVERFKQIAKVALTRPINMMLTEVIVLSLALYTAYAYAMIFCYFASSSYVLQVEYGFNMREVGLSFISVIIGYFLATFMFGVFDKTLYAKARNASPDGRPAPEHRLYSGLVGSIFLPIGLFWYAWEAHRGGHWAALVAAGIPFGLGAFSLFLAAITYQVETYRAGAAASALASNGIIRYSLGATFPLFTVQMYENLGIHWAGSVFAFLSLGLLPIPWLLFKYGSKLRARSSFLVPENLPKA